MPPQAYSCLREDVPASPTDGPRCTRERMSAMADMTNLEQQQVDRANASGLKPVVFVHGLWLLSSSWDRWRALYEENGYTTLAPTHDRVLATSLTVEWTWASGAEPAWGAAYDGIRATLLDRFVNVHSLALQQTLWEMGRAVLEAQPDVASIELVAPNIHHVAVDLGPFGLGNPGEVFHVTDRPYGLIEVTVEREA